jgi:hypothetical protein
MGLKSSLSHVILAVTGSMLLSTIVVAQGISFRAGTWQGSIAQCQKDATAALVAAGFNQNITNMSGQPPSQAVGGTHADGPVGLIVCAQKGDLVLVVSGVGPDIETKYMITLAQKVNETGKR